MITTAERSDDGILIRCTLNSSPDSVSATLRHIRTELAGLGSAVADDLPWELVVAEVLNNIVEHAYAGDATGQILASLAFRRDSLRADFTDYGAAMPGLAPPQGAMVDLSGRKEDLPEGGYGWFLIRSLSRDMRYRREDGANCLSLTIHPPTKG